jgi:glycosyltransferase involved in cell wall biosynthesis
MIFKLFIHATNVHQGGGRSLLIALLRTLSDTSDVLALLDSRMSLPDKLPENIQIKWVNPSVIERLKAEKWLAKNVHSNDIILCFGNLPPLFKTRGRSVVFVQNRYLVDDVELNGFPLRVRLRLFMERLWLSSKMQNASQFVVQTPTMKNLMEKKTQGGVPVSMFPYVDEPSGYSRILLEAKIKKEDKYDFVFVASGEPHKNHHHLIEAWCLLSKEGLRPSLCLTLDMVRFSTLCRWIVEMSEMHGLHIVNVGSLAHQEIPALYSKAGALIYPSTFESFGLPLTEARQAGLPILAAELDYVRDVIDPEQTFDPVSPTSIARAVKRHLGKEEQKLPLMNAKEFIERIMNMGNRPC